MTKSEYQRKRRRENPDKARKQDAQTKQWKERNPERYAELKRRSWLKHRAKHLAREKVASAIRDGRMERGGFCQMCLSGDRLNAHHSDYSRPLDVIWLCIPCHKLVHSKG